MSPEAYIALAALGLTLLTFIVRLTIAVTKIQAQLFPNGGTSMRDKIDELSHKVTRLEVTMTEVRRPKR